MTLFVQAAAAAAVIAPAVAAPRLLQALQLDTAAVGLFVALVYLAAMFSSPLGAWLVRRLGPLRASQVALVMSALGLAALALAAWPPQVAGAAWPPEAARALPRAAALVLAALGALGIGLGYGPITPASSQMLARTTDPRHYALVFSIKQTGVPLGGVIAGLLVPPLVAWGGPGLGAVAALGGMALLCLAGAWLAAPLRQALDAERENHSPWPRPAQLLAPVGLVWRHPALRAVAMGSLVFSMVQVSLTAYAVSYLTGDLRWGLVAAGAALSASQVAGVLGRVLWGLVADRWLGPRRMLLALALAMAACALAMTRLTPDTPTGPVLWLLCLFGATAVGWNGVYLATVARLVPQAQAGVATAGTLFFTFFGVVIGPPLFGLAGQLMGGLGPAFALLCGPLALGLVVLWRLRVD